MKKPNTKRATAAKPTATKPSAAKPVEWTAGVVRMPGLAVHEDGTVGRVDCLVWVGAGGMIFGHRTEKPEELEARMVESFRATCARPLIGPPHKPDLIRVASAELAEALAGCGVDVAIGIKPEVEALLAQMRAHFEGKHAERDIDPPSYLSPEVDAAAVASLFRACAELYRAKPWKVISSDRAILSLTIEALDVRDAVLSVVGQMGESFGVLMFKCRDDFDTFSVHATDGAGELDDDELDALNVQMPSIFSINFERGPDLPPELRKEIATHRWEVADAKGYPQLINLDAGMVPRGSTAREYALAEAIAHALMALVREKKAVKKAIEEGERMVRSYSVVTQQGAMEVKLALPFDEPQVHTGLLAKLKAVEGTDTEDAYNELCNALLSEFESAPEAVGVEQVHASSYVMEFAANDFDISVASMTAPDLQEIVFGIIPREVTARPSDALAMIVELRAFYAFLKRAYALKQADACLRVLGGDAPQRLADALGDASNFGMAKSMFAQGAQAGFDMSLGASKKRASPAEAKSRKDARKARKKNR